MCLRALLLRGVAVLMHRSLAPVAPPVLGTATPVLEFWALAPPPTDMPPLLRVPTALAARLSHLAASPDEARHRAELAALLQLVPLLLSEDAPLAAQLLTSDQTELIVE